MIPDALVFPAADRTLNFLDAGPERLLSRRVATHLARARDPDLRVVLEWLHAAGGQVPGSVQAAAARLAGTWNHEPTPGDNA
jgi:hypothetical protein